MSFTVPFDFTVGSKSLPAGVYTVKTGLAPAVIMLIRTDGRAATVTLTHGVEARRIAALVGVDLHAAEVAGWLHDISAIFPSEQRAVIAEQLGIEVLPEEAIFPMIIQRSC
jgi:hypothetical protein